MKSGNLNFLEPSGPLQACNGTALPFLHVMVFPTILHVRKHRFPIAHVPSPQSICPLSFIFVTSSNQSHYPHGIQWADYTTVRPINRYSKRGQLNGSQRRKCDRDAGCCDADSILLGCYTMTTGDHLLTFLDKSSASILKVKQSERSDSNCMV